MSKVLINRSNLEDIADAIREKNGESTQYKPREMAAAISDLPSGAVMEPLTVTKNGTYTPDTGVDGFSSVEVNVSGGLQPESITPVDHPSSYLNHGDGRLCINDSRTPSYSFISIDLSLYEGKILIIKNDGNRNYFGFYSSIANETTQQIYSERQSAANGILKICVDNFYPRLSGARYVCYDYTSNNQTQGMPSVEIVDANDL